MNVLLTGATGLLGVHITRELIQQGYQVQALYRSLPKHFEKLVWFKEVEWIKGAITSPADVEAAMKGCQAVIHAAARTDPSPSTLASYYEANIAGTETILTAARRARVSRLVYVSTASVYKPGSFAEPATERSPYAFHLMASGYIASKYQAQQRVLEEVTNGLNAVIVNPTFVLGPYDFKPSSGAIIQHVLQNGSVFYPNSGGKSFIDVRDAARATVNALREGKTGECYLLANEDIPYERFFPLVIKLAGASKRSIPVSSQLLRSVGWLGSAGEWLTRQPYKLNSINARLMTQDNYYSGRKAATDLQMPHSSVEQAIQDTINWFRTEQI